MDIQENVSLLSYNTFGIAETAARFIILTDKEKLSAITALGYLPEELHIIGGGSNILLTQPIDGLTILNQLKGIEVVNEDEDHVWVRVSSGEGWHDFVLKAIANGWAGIENLSLIPGTVGAAPMQNIGAYGVEVKQVIEEVTAWHWAEQKFITYNNEQCAFGYRDSVFKHELKKKVFITDVLFKLHKKPAYNTSYGAITDELQKMGVEELSIKGISDAVIAIRSSKLPDPKKIGNTGSFFKNPTIPISQYDQLVLEYPAMPSYPVDEQTIKVPAGWLIEKAGLKGYTKGNAGVHDRQALVLVNKGGVTGKEVFDLSEEILQVVKDKFGILLEREVQIW